MPPRLYFSSVKAQLGGSIPHLMEEKESCGGTPLTLSDLLRGPIITQVDKGDKVEYNGFNLNVREKCYVFNLVRGREAFWWMLQPPAGGPMLTVEIPGHGRLHRNSGDWHWSTWRWI